MVVQHKQRGGNGSFYVQVDGEVLAQMTYVQPNNETMVIEHTEVDEELRHENVGYQMVHTAVQYARNHKVKIVPMCPFVKAVFDKNRNTKDVLEDA